eukprot:1145958-Pelagomonas_calceolata.AAC.4
MSMLNRMGMQIASKFQGMLLVKSQLLKLRSAQRSRAQLSRPDASAVLTLGGRDTTHSGTHESKRQRYPQRHVHLVEVKYCEDIRSKNQLEASKQQHRDLRRDLSRASAQ